MKQIEGWIYNPAEAVFRMKGSSKRISLFQVYCERPEACDLYQKEKTCLLLSGSGSCRFGRKTETVGPTPRARNYYTVLNKWRESLKGAFEPLRSLNSYNRIFRAHGHYYLPYAHMAKHPFGSGYPLDSEWIPVEAMTAEVLDRICRAQPRAEFGGILRSYQKESVPKFITDLKFHYPELFELLPEDQKARLATISHVGRKADLTTCAPGEYLFYGKPWRWDGELLHGTQMTLPPTPGEVRITIKPEPGSVVEITDNAQVTEGTRFLD